MICFTLGSCRMVVVVMVVIVGFLCWVVVVVAIVAGLITENGVHFGDIAGLINQCAVCNMAVAVAVCSVRRNANSAISQGPASRTIVGSGKRASPALEWRRLFPRQETIRGKLAVFHCGGDHVRFPLLRWWLLLSLHQIYSSAVLSSIQLFRPRREFRKYSPGRSATARPTTGRGDSLAELGPCSPPSRPAWLY